MEFRKFKERFQSLPVIESYAVTAVSGEDPQVVRNQLVRWQQQGLIKQLRKGMYILNEVDRKRPLNEWYIANRLYEPSYVSLETALSFYEIIPERVVRITSITARKTKSFTNALGHFEYRHVKKEAFRGFREIKQDGCSMFIAEREKAIVDFIYLNVSRFTGAYAAQLVDSYRFQELHTVRKKKLVEYGALCGSPKVMRIVEAVIALAGKNKRKPRKSKT